MNRIDEQFAAGVQPPWVISAVGTGRVVVREHNLHLMIPPTPAQTYSNAQITDYTTAGADAFRFGWRPPLRLTVTAYATHPAADLRGTAGFGFWNHPFSPDVRRLPRLPQAIWFFFGAPPSNMALAQGVPGAGWKAATIDATQPRALALIPAAPFAVALMNLPALERRLWPPIQRALRINEHLIDGALLAERHTYTLDWRMDRAAFAIDGVPIFTPRSAPRGPCGFIAWLDTQFAIVTPRGRIGFGLVPVTHEQTLILERITIEPGQTG
ncbi:MAG: hypothetical protein GYB67_04575 [Chloroflexi bacterium]|nr:hypothetical protein [Chloroflexota bacterium]